ncbi:hypothetical protein [Arthrobacter sp. IK3]|uniref:hypothetical protein n=1 Tax=Arthrobacter sp. IK3 TaxID=3448169 RepID=UPI003EDECA7D
MTTASLAAALHARSSPAPLEELTRTLALSSQDWAASPDFAWIYGITVGWDGRAMLELAARFGWDGNRILELRRLRREYRKLQLAEERRRQPANHERNTA